MASSKPKQNRNLRTLLIEPFRQMKFGLYMITLFIFFLGITLCLLMKAFFEQYRNVMEVFHIVDPDKQWDLVLNNVFYSNALWIGGFFLASLLLILGVIISLTHRYYGPIIAIERFVDNMTAGHYESKIALRKKDELQELASKLNAMAVALQKRHGVETKRKPLP
jgi:HAMP domain-containing protein